MKTITMKPHESESRKARARFLVLAILALIILFHKPLPASAAGINDFDRAYSWKLIDTLSGLPKTGDQDVFSDTGWYPILMGVRRDNKYPYAYLANLRGKPDTRFGQDIEIEGFASPSNKKNAFPYEKNESMTLSDYGCLYIKYAGKNLNQRDVYYLKRDDGKILVNSINSEHKGYLIAVTPENLKKQLNPKIIDSTWAHYSCHENCWYEGLHTWEFIRDPAGPGKWAFSIRSGGCKYKEYSNWYVFDDIYDGAEKRVGQTNQASYEQPNYYFYWDTPTEDSVNFWITTKKCYYSIHMGSYQNVNRIMKSMTIGGNRNEAYDQEYLIASSEGPSIVAPEATITVGDGGKLLVENDVIWAGSINIQEGGTMILYPGARVILTGNWDYSCMFNRGSLIVMKGATLLYAGNQQHFFTVQGNNRSFGSIYNKGVMLMGNTHFNLQGGAKLEVDLGGAIEFGKGIQSNLAFGISPVDDTDQSLNIRMKTAYPDLLDRMEKVAPGGNSYAGSQHLDINANARGVLSLGDQVLIRNNGMVDVDETEIEVLVPDSVKWIGSRAWSGIPASGTLPESIFEERQTRN